MVTINVISSVAMIHNFIHNFCGYLPILPKKLIAIEVMMRDFTGGFCN